MAHRALVARELSDGRLVEPFELRTPAPHRHAAKFPESGRSHALAPRFVKWLRVEASEG